MSTAYQFDASRVEPSKALDPVPTDWYSVLITGGELKATSGGTGEYANLEATITAGPYMGRKLYPRINTKNANAQAVEIGAKDMSAICHAVGVLQISDLGQLFNRPLEMRAVVRPPENGYDATNEIKGYRAVGSGKTPAGNGGAGGAPAAAPGGYVPPAAPPPPPAAAAAPPPPPAAPAWATPPAPPAAPAAAAPPPPPPAPPPPPPPAPAPVAAPFPPAGWTAHPNAPGYFYSGNDVKSEADLRAMSAAPAAPPAPPAPPAAPAAAAPPWAR